MADGMKTGARLLVDALERNGVSHVYMVPGESYLAVIDALGDSAIRTIVCRQEGGAAFMAEASGKLGGRPGIVMVTRGPGATNAAAGIHVAQQDSTPMILFIGQIERGMRGREAFQEIDYVGMFGGSAKWVAEIDSANRVTEMVSRAFHTATSGRPGPVVLVLPEDMLVETAPDRAAAAWQQVETHPGLNQMWDLQKRLWAAKRPIAILGGTRWSEKAARQFQRFAERFELPVAVSFRRQMLFDNSHRLYAGDVGIGINPALKARIDAADLVLLVGGRMSEIPSQAYTLFDIPKPKQDLVHVHPGAEELGRVYQPTLSIHASPAAFAAAAESLQPPHGEIAWAGAAEAAHADYLAFATPPATAPGDVDAGAIVRHLAEVLPDDAILTNGAGNYSIWLHRYWRFRRYGTQLSPTSGTMGYGVPAAIAAKLENPQRCVVSFAGDGCFLMNGQEFATAVQYDAAIVVIVFDNGMYGTIRMHQEREFPGRVHGTGLRNPDFAALARAFGGEGYTVAATDEFAPAFASARASGRPAIIHVKVDPEAILPGVSLTQIRERALARG